MAKRLFAKPLTTLIPRPGTVPNPGPSKPEATVEARPVQGGPSHDAIARAAYFRWLQFGGTPEENWAIAEQELRRDAAAG